MTMPMMRPMLLPEASDGGAVDVSTGPVTLTAGPVLPSGPGVSDGCGPGGAPNNLNRLPL